MRSTLRTLGTLAATALAAGGIAVTAAPAATAATGPTPLPIGPHQYFSGRVNGLATGAAIKVLCVGPVGPDSTGHPLSGQTVSVHFEAVPTSKALGYTGESADRVLVGFTTATTGNQPLTLTRYDVDVAIPTTLNLPCGGQGTVVFAPSPTSLTAQDATVGVTYVNVGV